MGRVTRRTPSYRLDLSDPAAPSMTSRPDTVTVEEPLEIRVGGVSLAVTMRTPGDDFDLTIGFLLTEGLIGAAEDVRALMHCQDQGDDGLPTYNVVDVTLAPGVTAPDTSAARRSYITSSCGICGKASIEAITTKSRYAVERDRAQVDPRVLATMPETLRAHQKVFDRTGGLHAAALFTAHGHLLVVREDVGRHNAVDKVIGWAALSRVPLICPCSVRQRPSELRTHPEGPHGRDLSVVSPIEYHLVDLAPKAGMTNEVGLRPQLTVWQPDRLGIQP